MKKEIAVNKDKTEVTLSLSLKRRIMARDPYMTITTLMAKTMLENENFKLDKCLVDGIIDNHYENSQHTGKWVFSLLVKQARKIKDSTPPPKTGTKKES